MHMYLIALTQLPTYPRLLYPYQQATPHHYIHNYIQYLYTLG